MRTAETARRRAARECPSNARTARSPHLVSAIETGFDRAGDAVDQAAASARPGNPLLHGVGVNPNASGHAHDVFAQPGDPLHDRRSTVRRSPDILVDVHSDLGFCGDGALATTKVAGMARVDDLPALHS